MSLETFISKSRAALRAMPGFQDAVVESSTPLVGDASARSYVRLNLSGVHQASIILMILAEGAGPVAGGGSTLTQSDTFFLLNPFLKEAGLPVPQIYYDGRADGFLLVEDVDDFPLWKLVFGNLSLTQKQLAEVLGGADPLNHYLRKALDFLSILRSQSPSPGNPAFLKYLSFNEYRVEAQRFVDLCLVPRGYPASDIKSVERMLDDLCRSLDLHPRVLCYRDYMAWNLMIDPAGDLRLLDYQDLLLGSPAYDVVTLLNDRDSDMALGRERWLGFASYSMEQPGLESKDMLLECALQRDLRLAGQFWNLSRMRGKPHYETWVPGCLRRIGRSMAGLKRWPEVLARLSEFFPEVSAGASDPWL